MVERDGGKGDDSRPTDPHAPTERAVPRAHAPKRRGDSTKIPNVGRMTMDFSGPPLELPGDGMLAPLDAPPLELDTTELEASERPATLPEPAPPRLELDLDGLEAPVEPRAHDAWVVDRHRRSTPPPKPWAPDVAPPVMRPSSVPARMPLPGSGDALGLVDRARPSVTDLDLASEMADRFALGDFTGALRAAELVLGADPPHVQARRYAEASQSRLEVLHVSRLGGLDKVPRLSVAEADIRWLGLDHRAAFLLSRIDGSNSFEELLDLSAMPRLEALKTLVELLDSGVIRTDRSH
jgi:hypothetical protein